MAGKAEEVKMETKAFEIRDVGTFIPVIATRMLPIASPSSEEGQAEYYLLRRAGYAISMPGAIIMSRMDSRGRPHQASYDHYSWGMARTLQVAHEHIWKNWDKLLSGEVIDVQFILGETKQPKLSERFECA